MSKTEKLRADFLLLCVAIVWGSSFTLMKNVINEIPICPYLAGRFLVASITLLIIFRENLKNLHIDTWKAGTLIGIVLFGGMGLQVYGLMYTTATKSAFLAGMNFMFVPFLSILLLKKTPNKATFMGIFIALVGLFFLSGGLELSFGYGDFVSLISAFLFGLQIVLIDKYTNQGIDASLIAVLQISTAAVLFLLLWVVFPGSHVTSDILLFQKPLVLFTILFTGVLGTAAAFCIQTMVQRFTTPSHTALILAMEPVFGAVFAFLIPDIITGQREVFDTYKILGCSLMFLGTICCEVEGILKNKLLSGSNRLLADNNFNADK